MRTTDVTNRVTPYKLRNGKVLKNRVVVPPMASETADSNGDVTEQTLSHYARLTETRKVGDEPL